MNRWNKLRQRLPKLPRGWRVIRNLALAAAGAVGIGVLLEWPALTPGEAFRRAEGAYLLTPSRTVLQVEGNWCTGILAEGDSWITVGEVHQISTEPVNLRAYRAIINHALPKEGLVVVLLPAKNEQDGAIAAVWGAPEEAVSGTLELDLMGIEDPWHGREIPGLETFTAQARRREDGWFIFQFVPHDNHREGQSCAMEMLLSLSPTYSRHSQTEQPYRLTLTDSQGRQAAYQAGTLPPNRNLWYW